MSYDSSGILWILKKLHLIYINKYIPIIQIVQCNLDNSIFSKIIKGFLVFGKTIKDCVDIATNSFILGKNNTQKKI